MSSPHTTSTHCRNCGVRLEGPYCHECGQHDFDFHRSFGHVALDALENFFHFDGKLFRNMVTLLFSPGRLAAEFNAGKRVSQMPPFRLYLFISVLFFFVSFHSSENGVGVVSPESQRRGQAGESSKVSRVKLDFSGGRQTATEQWVAERAQYAAEHQGEIVAAFVRSLPKMLLLCLPLFALTLRVVYRKSGYSYLQQLVVALHFHTFLFLWILVVTGYASLAGLVFPWAESWVTFGGTVWLILYPVLMLRRLFPQGWRRGLVRAGVVFGTHVLTLLVALIGAAGIAFAMA